MARHLTRRPDLPVRSVRPARPAATAAVLAAVLALGPASCTGDPGPDPAPAVQTVTVDHPMGTTEVPLNPATVVGLSPVWEDAFAALGDPVDVSFRGGDLVPAPWEVDTPPGKLMSLPPGRYNRSADVLDEIRDAAPDLILAGEVGDAGLYRELSGIAPTVVDGDPVPDDDDPAWPAVTRYVGQILDRGRESGELVVDVQGKIRGTPARDIAVVADPGIDVTGKTPDRALVSVGQTRVDEEWADVVLDLSGPDGAAVASALYVPTVRSVPWLLELLGT